MFTWKTQTREKTTGDHRLRTVHYVMGGTIRDLEATTSRPPRALSLCQTAVTTDTPPLCISFSLTHSLIVTLYTYTLCIQDNNNP